MDNWKTNEIKREIFDIQDKVRILWNDFYRKDGEFNETDLKAIENIMKSMEYNFKEIKEMI